MKWYRTKTSNMDPYADLEAFVAMFDEAPPPDLQMRVVRRDREKGFKMQGDDLVYTKEEDWVPPSVAKERKRWRAYWS